MTQGLGVLTAEDHAIIVEEERLLERSRAAIAKEADKIAKATRDAREHPSELRSIAALRMLREEAQRAAEDDLPALLLEMSVRQHLVQCEVHALVPDPDAPYFAHLRVRERTESGRPLVKDYLLGRASLLDARAGVRILDWRVAPIARIFYRYREGEDYEESFPGRDVEGSVDARRVVVIERGKLAKIASDDRVLTCDAEGQWSRDEPGAGALAAGGAGTAVRHGGSGDVTALLDREQFEAVTAPAERALLVLGSAGSGKTTVALHRLARLASSDPSRYPLDRASVVVPDEGLARLSRRLLLPLGASEAQVQTLDAWACDLARRVFGEPMPKLWLDAPGVVASMKRHPALHDALRERFATLAPTSTTLPRLRKRLADVFTDRAFLGDVVERSRGDLPRTVVEETVRHTMLQLAAPLGHTLAFITDPERRRAIDGRAIDEGTPDELAGSIDVEDLPVLLFLRAWRAGIDAALGTSHLVLDEAEDFSLFELHVLGKLLASPPSVTLAGDEAQQTSPCFAGWSRSVEALGAAEIATCRLEISYRCPRPVAEIARAILGPLASPTSLGAARDGAPVGRFAFPEEAHAHLFLVTALRDLVDREPLASVAVLAHDEEAARRFFEIAVDVPSARLISGGEFSFAPGIDVTDVDSAKGLEFDYVVVPDATASAYPRTDDARRRLHVAATRASHQLWLVSGGAPSPLLVEEAETSSVA